MYFKYVIALFAAVLVGLGVYWYFFGVREVRNYPSSGTDIIAFGDSLVAGVGASPGRDFVSLLSQKIGQPIISLGVSGDTTASALARVGELDAYRPKVVIVLFGGNDYLQRVPPAQTFDNLTEIVENVQARCATRTTPHTFPTYWTDFWANSSTCRTKYTRTMRDTRVLPSAYTRYSRRF